MGRVVLTKNEHTHSIRLPAQESQKHETTKLLNFAVASTRCPVPASAHNPGHGSLRAARCVGLRAPAARAARIACCWPAFSAACR